MSGSAPPSGRYGGAAAYLFPIIVLANFTAGLAVRALDPVLPLIAQQFTVSAAAAASLSAASSVAFAIMQLPLGAIADLYGKQRIILTCIVTLGIANLIGATTASFELLFASRVLCGIAAGGTTPIAVSLVGDLFPVETRRVANARLLAGVLTGQLLGASFAGILGDIFGWRGVLVVIGILVLMTSALVGWGFRHRLSSSANGQGFDVRWLFASFRRIASHPNAQLGYFLAFCEGACVLGIMPYIAAFLRESGETRSAIAGYVIGGFAIGGLSYSIVVKPLLARLGDIKLMQIGAVMTGTQVLVIGFGPPWYIQMISTFLIGFGLYAMHGGLLIYTGEVAPALRSTALSLQAFFFNFGQFAGPLMYGVAVTAGYKLLPLTIGGGIILAAGFVCAALLRHRPPVDVNVPERPPERT